MHALRSELLPEPTSPMTQRNSPLCTYKSRFLSVINFPKVEGTLAEAILLFTSLLSIIELWVDEDLLRVSSPSFLSSSSSFFLSFLDEKPQLKFPVIEKAVSDALLSTYLSIMPPCTSSRSRNPSIRFIETTRLMTSEKKNGTWISGPCIRLKIISAAAATLKSNVCPVPMNVENVTAGSRFGNR